MDWPSGSVRAVEPAPAAMARAMEEYSDGAGADALLCWDSTLAAPDARHVHALLGQPGDIWHAGLRLETLGQPGIIDFVKPTWMHNRDPDPDVEATSWRLSLRACLLRTKALRQLGGPDPRFASLDAAALELGHRYLRRGALVRHIPNLVPDHAAPPHFEISAEDELRFVFYRFGRKWARWAVLRALLTGYRPRAELLAAWRGIHREHRLLDPQPYRQPAGDVRLPHQPKVTVLIPTLERYAYLHRVLDQLGAQTVQPHQVVVVDQTPRADRDASLRQAHPELPLDIIHLDEPGQCSARNAGLRRAEGEFVLFIDDDDEIEPDLIELHLRTLMSYACAVSSGVADEAGAGELPSDFRFRRVSDVFPANNTLIRTSVLKRSGLFDTAFDRGQRADAELGMRLYLSGTLMMLNPEISVFHHHAPRGGLRAHNARVITYASSRRRLTHRHLPSASEIYLMRRYFSARQVREALWIRAAGTLSMEGSRWKRLAKAAWAILCLPDTLLQVRRRSGEASRMLSQHTDPPTIDG